MSRPLVEETFDEVVLYGNLAFEQHSRDVRRKRDTLWRPTFAREAGWQ